jgi:predicted phage terminase large subunit-like protein
METLKNKMSDWDDFAKNIFDSTGLDKAEKYHQRIKRMQKLEANPEAWFRYYFPKYYYAEPAKFHKEATKRVLENTEWYEVRIWSRELAKSTRTMMEVLYLCLLRKKKYVLMISNSLDNATRLLMPYKLNLEYNRRIINDYGVQEQSGKWQAAEFVTLNGVAFRALGAGQSPRGTRNEEARPDVILFDDIDTDTECRNPEIIAKKWKWIEEAAISTRSVSKDTLIIFCGNRIAKDCCIERACKLADHVDEVNIRDEQGKSAWPQKNSELDIERVLSQKSYASAQKEYYNNPVTEGSVFKEMAYKPARPMKDYQLLVCYTDPSFRDAKTNDYKATVLVGKWQDEYHVIKCYLEQTTTAKMVDWHFHIKQIIGTTICYYYMEQGFLQDTLIKEFYDICNQRGGIIPVSGDSRSKQNKFTRIESLLEPLNRNGKLFLNEHEKQNPHMQRLEEQFLALAPQSRAHDDGPDAVEGAVWMINDKLQQLKPGSFMNVPRNGNRNRY